MRKALTLCIPAALTIAVVLAGCPGKKPATTEKQQEKGTAIRVALVEQRDIIETVEVTGSLAPVDEVNVGSRSSGKIVWLIGRGKTGTRVTKGQVVARLETTDADIQVRSATAALNAAKARLEQAKAAVLQQRASTDAGISNANAAIEAATARFQQAQSSRVALETTTRAQIRASEQVLSAAKSRYDMVKNGSRDQERQIAQNNVNLAKGKLDLDQANYDRYAALYEKGAISRVQYESYALALQLSKVQYDSALQQLDLVQTGPRKEDLDMADAQVKQAEAGLDAAKAGLDQLKVAEDSVEIARTGIVQAKAALQSAQSAVNVDVMRDKDVLAADAAVQQVKETLAAAQEMLANTRVIAPVSGIVSQTMAEVGQSIGGNASILRITTDKALFFETKVSELQATRLRAGQLVTLRVDALEGDRESAYKSGNSAAAVTGVVEKVVPVVDAQTRSFTVRVVVPATPALFPGMFARGLINLATHERVPTIPRQAVIDRDGKQMVFIVDDGKARQRPVVLGAQDKQFVQVRSGVLVGDRVIVSGQQSLINGDPVMVTE